MDAENLQLPKKYAPRPKSAFSDHAYVYYISIALLFIEFIHFYFGLRLMLFCSMCCVLTASILYTL